MNIRRLSEKDYEQIKHVWKVCFGDSDLFIDTYFRYAAAPADGRGTLDDGGLLLADIFMLDFKASLSGAGYDTKFLAGCATMPEGRKKGLMREMVRSALREMKRTGISVSYLHPFLHAFYRKFGYETVAYVKRHEEIVAAATNGAVRTAARYEDAPPAQTLLKAYDKYMGAYDNYFIRSVERMDTWLRLLFADKGTLVCTGDETPAYLMYFENDEGVREVFELVCFSDDQRKALLSATGGTVKYFLPALPGDDGAEEFTMMRVVDPAEVLKRYPYENRVEFVIRIEDAFLGEDHNVLVRTTGDGKADVEQSNANPDISIDINMLAQLVSGSVKTYHDALSQTVFKRKKACFFETY